MLIFICSSISESEGLVCSEECTDDGCWGLGPEQCLECKHFKYNNICIRTCYSLPNIYQKDAKTCEMCHPECDQCRGPGADNCVKCKNVSDGKYCVPFCPDTKYANANRTCVPCHETCVGCTGPRNTIAPFGCITCEKAILREGFVIERCLKKNESCPGKFKHKNYLLYFVYYLFHFLFIDGFFNEWGIRDQGPLTPLAGKSICRECHPRCKRCTGFGFHEQVCQKCSKYKRGEQCEDECPTDYYADEERSECFPCDAECRGCTGPGTSNCIQCRNLKIYEGDPASNSTLFNCTLN